MGLPTSEFRSCTFVHICLLATCLWCGVSSPVHAVSARLQLLDGSTVDGELVVFDDTTVTLRVTGNDAVHKIDSIQSIDFKVEAATGPWPITVWVRLSDGSSLAAQSYQADTQEAQLQLPGGEVMVIPLPSVTAVRFDRESPAQHAEWVRMLEQGSASDGVVVNRAGGSLDVLEGTLGPVTSDTIEFEYEGESRRIRREKVAGLLYHPQAVADRPLPVGQIIDRRGNVYAIQGYKVDAQQLQMALACGLNRQIALDELATIRFAQPDVTYLSDLEPTSWTWEPWIPDPQPSSPLKLMYRPVKDRAFDGQLLSLDGTGPDGDPQFEKGLTVHSRTELVYRLAGDYQGLAMLVGLDPKIVDAEVRVSIFGDDRLLWETVVEKEQRVVPCDISVRTVKRLRILVDYGDRHGIADRVHLCNARLIRQ